MAEFKHLGIFLKAKRATTNFTQGGLAGELGNVHSQFISNWERGLCAPPTHCFPKLISLLKIDKKELVRVMMKDAQTDIEARIYKKKANKR